MATVLVIYSNTDVLSCMSFVCYIEEAIVVALSA